LEVEKNLPSRKKDAKRSGSGLRTSRAIKLRGKKETSEKVRPHAEKEKGVKGEKEQSDHWNKGR